MNGKIDFKQLCQQKSISFPQDAFNAHYTKRNQLNLIRELLEDYSKITAEKFQGNDRHLNIASMYIEYAAVLAYAQFDIFAEMINVMILNEKLDKRKTTIYNVKCALSDHEEEQNRLKAKIVTLTKSGNYKYLKELTNFIKHRSCTKPNYSISNHNPSAYSFAKFSDADGTLREGKTVVELFQLFDDLFNELLAIGDIIGEILSKKYNDV